MLGLVRGGLRSYQKTFRVPIPKHFLGQLNVERENPLSRCRCVVSSQDMQEKGLENVTVADVLLTKGEENIGSWISCLTNDTIEDAIKNMAEHNIGSLVVLKPGDQQHIAGIITERGNLNI
ncbi:Cystathionine beta-synthase family protein [Tripterygium wilfordii]|uniref:Cystathionine beta-synthase family protein n=1 Tax=Tripterygium wilfordii TaxID=458696 RepID=A0A7J7DLM0_TRIWF|nr:Cystathionine beta-synthase family protein [Tripterygium wilfordii]